MVIIKFAPERAESLLKTLAPLSDRAGVAGYLVGLVQDARRCVEVNLKNDADNDEGDVRIINDIVESFSDIETALSAFMSSAIVKSDNKK